MTSSTTRTLRRDSAVSSGVSAVINACRTMRLATTSSDGGATTAAALAEEAPASTPATTGVPGTERPAGPSSGDRVPTSGVSGTGVLVGLGPPSRAAVGDSAPLFVAPPPAWARAAAAAAPISHCMTRSARSGGDKDSSGDGSTRGHSPRQRRKR